MAFAGMNYVAILVAAVAAFAWGAAYYMTLSKQWLAAVQLAKPAYSAAPFVISFVALLVMAFVLSGAIGHLGPGQVTVKNGIISGAILWAGFVVTTVFVNNAYPGRKYMLSIIDSIHWLGVLVIQGAVIGALGGVMKRPRIEGYAIISQEGMIATSDGLFPEQLKIPADHTFYMDAVARASAVANGAHSAEGGPHEKERRRLRLTRRITKLMPDPRNTNVILWNPATAPFDEAWAHLRIDGGSLAVVGGTDVFGLFLGIGYDAFFLSRTQASVPRGRPVFPGVGKDGTTPADIMGNFDLVLRGTRMLDPASNTYVEEWGPKA